MTSWRTWPCVDSPHHQPATNHLLNASQSFKAAFFYTMWEGKKVIDVFDMWAIILHQSKMIQQSMPETRTFPWGEQAGCDWWRAQIDHSCTKKCPLQHWWWNWTAVPSNPGLSEQAAFNVLGKLPSPVCLFLDQKASQLQPLYSTQQFFAKCCQSQRLNDKNGEIWWNDVKSIQGLETTCLKISQNVARFLKSISESFRSSLLRHHSPPRAPVECRMSTHRMQEYNEQSSRWWSYLASRRAAM